jgi:hypothetical protein
LDRWEKSTSILLELSSIILWSTHASWWLWHVTLWWSHWHLLWSSWHTWLSSWHHWGLWHSLLSHVVILIVSLSTVVLSVVWVSSVLLLSSHVWTSVILLSSILLHKLEKLLDNLSQMWLRSEIVPLESTGLLLSIFFEIGLILKLSHLNLSNLFDFIVVDDQNFSINLSVRKLLLGCGAGIWLFIANESILVSLLVFLWL